MSTEKQRLTFISYSREDKEFALALAKELRSSGFLIWLDQLDIPTGSRWDDEVERALERCDIFMVILTPNSITSNNVKDEIGYAIDSNKQILPILLENAKVPFRLRRFQYVDFTNITYPEGIERSEQLLWKILNESIVPSQPVSGNPQNQQMSGVRSAKASHVTDEDFAPRRAETFRVAREKEQETQAFRPHPTTEKKSPETTPAQPIPKPMPIILGITSIMLLCVSTIWVARSYIFPPTPTQIPFSNPSNTPNKETPPNNIPSPTITITVPTPTFTPVPSAAVTRFSPEEPDQFIVFYFESLIYRRDFELCWSLLSDAFKSNGDPLVYEDWTATWEKVVEWQRPTLIVTYIAPAKVFVTSSEIWFRSSVWYSLSDRKYCLVKDEIRNTWIIDDLAVCGY